MQRSLELPQELIDLIIDNLRHDPLTLRACTLTCHAWLHRSRRHLHSRVRIGEYFINLERYSSPHVAHYVRELELYMVVSGRARQRVTTNAVWEMISRFPNVRSLTIRDLEVPRLSSTKLEILQTLCKQLQSLTLINVEFEDADDFMLFMSHCEQLIHLHIPRMQFYDRYGDTDNMDALLSTAIENGLPIPGHSIRYLSLGTFSSEYVAAAVEIWFAALVSSGSLKESAISRDTCLDEPADFAEMFSAIGSKDMDLTISCKGGTRFSNQDDTGIQLCTNLRSITFISPPDYLPPSQSQYSRTRARRASSVGAVQSAKPNQAWIHALLSQLSSPSQSLVSMTFEVHWTTIQSVNPEFLSTVDDVLMTRKDAFGGLHDLKLVVHHHFGLPFANTIRRVALAGSQHEWQRRDQEFKDHVLESVRQQMTKTARSGVRLTVEFPQAGWCVKVVPSEPVVFQKDIV
ncbi:hypothetical protein C8Q75DRAFT_577896 [Abortiporus biennis]|nr:hypothetical protein C8Q75DRAFT_577896 [Abortiporus biennis]